MLKGGFIALINPTIALAIAAALLILWNYRRQHRYIAVLAAAFLTLACAFLLQYISAPLKLAALKLVYNPLIVVGGCLLIHGTLGRYRIRPPFTAMVAICCVGLTLFVWYLYGDPDITARIYVMNFLAGALVLLLGAKLYGVKDKKLIDKVLTAVVLLWGLHFFLRTPAAVWYEGPYAEDVDLFSTLYWITVTLSVAFFLLIFSVLLIAAVTVDVIEDLRTESYTDALSRLLNRRGFEEHMGRAAAEARGTGVPLSLVLCDLDSFKSINDTYGHMTGDKAIAAFADCLRRQLTGAQLAARIGGEEFAVLLPAAETTAARLFAEAARVAFSAETVEGIAADDRLTASFGVAELLPGEDWPSLVRRADVALYRAKSEGRDRVRVCDAESEPAPAGGLRRRGGAPLVARR